MIKRKHVVNIFQAMKKKLPLMLLITVAVTVIGGVFSVYKNEKKYESTVTFTFGVELTRDTEELNALTGEPIKEKYIQFGTYSVYNESYQFFMELLKSDELLNEVNETLDLGITNSELENSISLINHQGSGILKLNVRMANNEKVDEVANQVASVFQRRNIEITELDNLKIINSADVVKIINTVNIKRNIILSVGIGLLIAAIVVIISELFRTLNLK